MKTTLLLLAVGLFSATVSRSEAQIGWTLGQCKQAFGDYTTSGNITYQFANDPKSDYVINIEMRNGLVEAAQYDRKYDPAKVTEKDIQSILVDNSRGYIWTKTGQKGSGYNKVEYYTAHIDGKIGMRAILRKGSLGVFAAD